MQNKDRVKFVLISISVVIPMDEGKFPTEWLLCEFTSTRNGQIIQQFGISPDKLFDARFRNSNFMDSENELLERSNRNTSLER